MVEYKECPRCGEEFLRRGEAKKYCSGKCKSAAFMEKRRYEEKEMLQIEKILRNNRKILFSIIDKESVSMETLDKMGFIMNLHTARKRVIDDMVILYYDIGIYRIEEDIFQIITADEI